MTEARPLCVLYPVPGESWDSPVCQKGASPFPSPMKRQALLPLTSQVIPLQALHSVLTGMRVSGLG